MCSGCESFSDAKGDTRTNLFPSQAFLPQLPHSHLVLLECICACSKIVLQLPHSHLVLRRQLIWKFPKNLSPEALWLAHYVILSRPRSLANLLSFGLPSRKILEAGPPQAITAAFQRVFRDKIEKIKEACAEARRELGWPARLA